MLQMVSWKEYFSLIGLGLVVYYGYVLVRYYPREIRELGRLNRKPTKEEEYELDEEEPTEEESVSEKPGKPDSVQSKDSSEAEVDVLPEELIIGKENETLLVTAQTLSKEIRALVQEAAEKKTIREELIMALRLLLRKDRCQELKTNPVFIESINNLILFDVEHNCSIQLDAEELKALWVS